MGRVQPVADGSAILATRPSGLRSFVLQRETWPAVEGGSFSCHLSRLYAFSRSLPAECAASFERTCIKV